MKPTFPDSKPSNSYQPGIQPNFLHPLLFYLYVLFIVFSILVNVVSTSFLLNSSKVFHFSFRLILVQVLICGTLKLIVRCLSIIDFNAILHLLQFELLFDFGMLLFIFLMSINRFVLILLPTRQLVLDKKLLHAILSIFIWLFPIIAFVGFLLGQCERMLLEDKTFTDQCYHSFYTAIAGKFPEYFENPTPYDIAETIRDITLRCYDILPIIAFLIYTLITWLLFRRRKLISSSQRALDYKMLAQGFTILGTASIVNVLLSFYSNSMRKQFSPFMQAVLFFSIALDVITVALIPLSIMAVSPAMRTAPRQILNKWRAKRRRRNLARHAVTKWRGATVSPVVRESTPKISVRTPIRCVPVDAQKAAVLETQPSAEPPGSSERTADSSNSKSLKVIQPEWAISKESPSIDITSLDVIVTDAHELVFENTQEKQIRMMNVGKGRKMFKACINDNEYVVTPNEGFIEAGAIATLTIKNRADPVKKSSLKVEYSDAIDLVSPSNVIGSRCCSFTVQLRQREKPDQGIPPSSVAVYPREICFSKNGKPGSEERKLVLVNFSGNRKAFMVHASRAIHEHTHNKATSGFIKPESFGVMTVHKAMAVTPNAHFEVGFVDANLIVASPAVSPQACELVIRSQNVEKKRVTVTCQ